MTEKIESYRKARLLVSEKIAKLQALQEEADNRYQWTGKEYYYGKITAYENAIQILIELHDDDMLFILKGEDNV